MDVEADCGFWIAGGGKLSLTQPLNFQRCWSASPGTVSGARSNRLAPSAYQPVPLTLAPFGPSTVTRRWWTHFTSSVVGFMGAMTLSWSKGVSPALQLWNRYRLSEPSCAITGTVRRNGTPALTHIVR